MKHNYNQQQHKILNNQTRKLLTYEQTEPSETEAWFKGWLHHSTRKQIKTIILQLPGLQNAVYLYNTMKIVMCTWQNLSLTYSTMLDII